jgi:ABC-type xylose transport system permease subunit
MQLVGLQDFYQLLAKGVILLAVVGLDTYQKSRKARGMVEKVAV